MDTVDKRELSRGFNSSSGSFELVLSPVLLALAGRWLDGRLGSGPWLMVLGAVMGLAGAAVKMYYVYQYRMAQHATDARSARESRSAAASNAVATESTEAAA